MSFKTVPEFNQITIDLQKKALSYCVWISCLNCENWQNNTCAKFKATPPAEIIVVGCVEHLPKIPF